MKIQTTWTPAALIVALFSLAACSPAEQESISTTKPTESAERRPQPEPEGEPFTITITGDDTMRFDVKEFSVKARQPVTILFRNVGTMPKESMGHNIVVLEKDVDKIEFALAGAPHPRNEYVDPEREDEVIDFTPILGPGEEAEISFTAPAVTGDYDYICSFPGHAQAGMVGVMKVE